YLCKLKSYVRNKAHPEASIANTFLADECMVFCSRYLEGFSTKHNKPSRNEENQDHQESDLLGEVSSLFPPVGKPLGRPSSFILTDLEKLQAHRYVLYNCKAVIPYL
ncbi:Unknown protein, partial [Striga hermonthica]